MRRARRLLAFKQRRHTSLCKVTSGTNSYSYSYSLNGCEGKKQRRGYSSVEVVGGRSSQSGIVATVFGASGMMGSYIVSSLGRFGSNVVVPFRGQPGAVSHLKTSGDLGQIVPVWWNPYHKESIRRAIQHSSLVINCVGSMIDTKNFSIEDTNIEVTRNIAEVCAEKDVRFIQLSAIGADPTSYSRFARTKGEAEIVLRSYLPKATVVRPSPIFCMQDDWTNRFAYGTAYGRFIAYNTETRVQPIYASDLANMIISCVLEDKTQGQTIEACGPTIYTMEQIYSIVQYLMLREDQVLNFRPSVETQKVIASIYENTFGIGGYRHVPMTTNELEWYRATDLVETGRNLTRRDLGYTTDQLSDFEEVSLFHLRYWRESERYPLELKFLEPREAPFLKSPGPSSLAMDE